MPIETLPAPPKRGQVYYVNDDGRYVFLFDHHIIQQFSTCEQYFRYRTMDNLRLKGPQRACISIGQWWSGVMEYFYTLRPKDEPIGVEAIIACAGKSWAEGGLESMKQADPKRYEQFAMPTDKAQVAKLIGQAGADILDDIFKGPIPFGPIIMAVKYFLCYANLDAQNWKVIAAERAFGDQGEVFVGENENVVVYYMGKPDLVVYEPANNLLMPVDHKTKDHIPYDVEVIWKPHPQTAGYIYAVQQIAKQLGYDVIVDRCVLNIAARLDPGPKAKNQRRFHRVRPSYSQGEIEEWRVEIMNKATSLAQAIDTNTFIRHENACHIYAGCEFRRVCSQPQQNRQLVIDSDFVVSEPWSPFSCEED